MPCIVIAVALLSLLVWQLDRTQLREDTAFHAGWRAESHVVTGICRLIDDRKQVRLRAWGGECEEALAKLKDEGGLEQRGDHLVVMLHGLGRSRRLFTEMERSLRAAGYETLAMTYPSLTRDVSAHADQLEALLAEQQGVTKVSFVTHSLGALVLRETLARESGKDDATWRNRMALGRAVLLGAPNQGAEIARFLDPVPPFHLFGGPSATQLAEGTDFPPLPADFEFGVIAGGRGESDGDSGSGVPWQGYNPLLSGDNDGVVTVDETQLEGAQDFRRLPVLHTTIASDPATIEQTQAFLALGRFLDPGDVDAPGEARSPRLYGAAEKADGP